MGRWGRATLLAAGFCLLAGCHAIPSPAERLAAASALAAGAGFAPYRPAAAMVLPLRGFARLACPGEELHAYVEGDGLAWVTATQPSADPTPLAPVALQLAALDPACNVLYLGRPGQYGAEAAPRYWLEARFAPEVVDSTTAAVREAMARQRSPRVRVAGFSGGGAVAALVAARLAREGSDVALVTVGGNLDPDTWTQRRRLSPLRGSLNPVAESATLARVPQLHLVGRDDRQVPRWVLDAYLAALGDSDCVAVTEVAAGHAGPWAAAWTAALAAPPACGPARAAGR